MLLPDTQLFDNATIPLDIAVDQVIEETTTLTDELEEAAPRRMVFRMQLQVLGELVDALRKDGDLDFRCAGVVLVLAVLAYDF